VTFIEKWTLFSLVLMPYWYFSYKIIEDIAYPDLTHRECGTVSFSIVVFHAFLAAMVAFIPGMKLWFGKGYEMKNKLAVLLLIFVPLLISFVLSGSDLYQ
ncbi:MAG: hypothetical protein O9353_01195, partial [Bacteroidia bacterium]|nr:hypothetical protein [Bacteroidia bacterium]